MQATSSADPEVREHTAFEDAQANFTAVLFVSLALILSAGSAF